jgi:HEAT repeat protein
MVHIARAQSMTLHRNLMVLREGDTLLAKAPPASMRLRLFSPDADDPELQIRINALDAMIAGKRDETAFKVLQDIALDGRQPIPIRHVALNSLTEFPQKDPGAVFLAVANRDTNETIQRIAIELFAASNRSRGDRTERLMDMFRRFEKSAPRREGALSTTLYALATIGDDRAIDFIVHIARSSTNQPLRSDAIYYLGNIGTDRARQALFRIVRGEY